MLFGVHPFAQHLFKTMSSDKPVWLQTEFARSYIYHSVTLLPSDSITYSHTFFEYMGFSFPLAIFAILCVGHRSVHEITESNTIFSLFTMG
jgi:hypothetical protein